MVTKLFGKVSLIFKSVQRKEKICGVTNTRLERAQITKSCRRIQAIGIEIHVRLSMRLTGLTTCDC